MNKDELIYVIMGMLYCNIDRLNEEQSLDLAKRIYEQEDRRDYLYSWLSEYSESDFKINLTINGITNLMHNHSEEY